MVPGVLGALALVVTVTRLLEVAQALALEAAGVTNLL